jgi:hypothetical protein
MANGPSRCDGIATIRFCIHRMAGPGRSAKSANVRFSSARQAATGRGRVKTQRQFMLRKIGFSERAVFDYFGCGNGPTTPQIEIGPRFHAASVGTSRKRRVAIEDRKGDRCAPTEAAVMPGAAEPFCAEPPNRRSARKTDTADRCTPASMGVPARPANRSALRPRHRASCRLRTGNRSTARRCAGRRPRR